ncbi:MAG: ankyrin repeat domain-containing protein [Gaiellaceae bacterium]
MNLFALIRAADEDGVRQLLERRPEAAEERDEEGVSAIRRAVYAGKDEIATILLDANPALDVFDAAAVGRTRGLEALLAGERELAQARASDGFTALHLAAFFGHEDAAALLLEHGADANAVARNAELEVAPLHSAAAGGHSKLVALLLEHGADPNARQLGGFTPLHAAAQNGDRESVEALLERGADKTARTDDGKTATELAAAAGHDDLGELLA